jgi:hypothetical protein
VQTDPPQEPKFEIQPPTAHFTDSANNVTLRAARVPSTNALIISPLAGQKWSDEVRISVATLRRLIYFAENGTLD